VTAAIPLYLWGVLTATVVPIAIVAIAIDVRAIRRWFERQENSHLRP
jgi:uncharacterized membrane-anchored protein